MEFFRDRDWDIVGKGKTWYILSGILIAAGIVVWAVMGLNYGIDFTGGSLHKFAFDKPVAAGPKQEPQVVARVRSMLAADGLRNTQIQLVGDTEGKLTRLYIRAPSVANDAEAQKREEQIASGLKKLFADAGNLRVLGRETVGPVIGEQLKLKAVQALLVGWVLMLIYITIRYQFRFAVAGIVALIHDTLIVMGCMALFQVELNSAFVAAILTVLGYSINDSVVIFDRIRENTRLRSGSGFAGTVNRSLLQTMARSVNTTVTTLFPLIALFVFGGQSIASFSLALIFGITTGSYSSIFIASPFVVMWEYWASERRARAAASAQTAQAPESAAATAAGPDPAEEGSDDSKPSQEAVIEKLQKEEADEREQKKQDALEEKRRKRRERKKKERREGGKSKRRY